MKTLCSVVVAILCLGCGPRGSGLDLTISLGGAAVPWTLTVDVVQVDGSGGERLSTETYTGSSFFGTLGTTNRVLIVPRTATISLDITAIAMDTGGGTVVMASGSYVLTPGIVTTGTLSLGGGGGTDAGTDSGGCGMCTGGRFCGDAGCECPANAVDCGPAEGCHTDAAVNCATAGFCASTGCDGCPSPFTASWCCNGIMTCCQSFEPIACTSFDCVADVGQCQFYGGATVCQPVGACP